MTSLDAETSPMYAGPECIEKSLLISALISNIDDIRSSIFHQLGMAISTISDHQLHMSSDITNISTIIDQYLQLTDA